jgi:hypothetical protein
MNPRIKVHIQPTKCLAKRSMKIKDTRINFYLKKNKNHQAVKMEKAKLRNRTTKSMSFMMAAQMTSLKEKRNHFLRRKIVPRKIKTVKVSSIQKESYLQK